MENPKKILYNIYAEERKVRSPPLYRMEAQWAYIVF
jgi:hypothetical protein